MNQVSIQFDRKEGARRRDAGIKKAVNHANAENREWETMAYEFFVNVFLKHTPGKFQCEDFRKAAAGVVPDPPSLRAYGGIITRAKFAGLIEKAGPPEPVNNSRANMAFAAVWRRVKH